MLVAFVHRVGELMTTQQVDYAMVEHGGRNGHAGSEEYTAEDITVMEGLEAVRRRPGMYIGTTGPEGVFHLVREIVDNSVDEAMAGFATLVDITLHSDGSVTVVDDGRGIPVDTHDKTGKSALETVMTTLHAGGKFGGKGYQVSGGLHGVGASVVNALSAWTVVEVRRDGKVYTQRFERGETVTDMSTRPQGSDDIAGDGTKVTWMPDSDIFPEIDYDWEAVSGRLREMAYLNQGLSIRIHSEWHSDGLWPHNDITFRFDGGVRSFVRTFNRRRGAVHDNVVSARSLHSCRLGQIVRLRVTCSPRSLRDELLHGVGPCDARVWRWDFFDEASDSCGGRCFADDRRGRAEDYDDSG